MTLATHIFTAFDEINFAEKLLLENYYYSVQKLDAKVA